MTPSGRRRGTAVTTRRAVPTVERWRLSDGEIHYLWWFIQGSIMEPGIRWRLRRAWGMCERHAWGALAVEAAFRHGYLHGPAVLYEDLIGRALRAFDLAGPWQARRLARRLRATGPCLMCEMGLGPTAPAVARKELIEQGRDVSALRVFADLTKAYWWKTVCGHCLGDGSRVRCRSHVLEDISRGSVVDLAEHRTLIEYIVGHLAVYARSFRWEYHHTESKEDQAAMISAVGWCSSWRAFIRLIYWENT